LLQLIEKSFLVG